MIDQLRTGLARLAFGVAAGLWILATAALQPGCGGELAVGGGIGGSGLVAGPIEELGSVVVAGIRFSIDDATIVVNGEPAEEGDLDVGMFVGVYGSFDEEGDSGTATRVEFEESVSGPISFVSVDRRRIEVLGQVVKLNLATRFVGIAAANLAPGVVVTVSGSRDADDAIVATFVARRLLAPGCRVLGDVEALQAGGSSFRIGDLEIDASAAIVIGGALVEGDSVGVFASSCDEGESILATEIRRLDVVRPPLPGPLRSVRGFVIEVRPGGGFLMHVPGLGRIPVELTPRTVFEGGVAGDLSRNDLLRVTGRLDGEGALRAGRIVFLATP